MKQYINRWPAYTFTKFIESGVKVQLVRAHWLQFVESQTSIRMSFHHTEKQKEKRQRKQRKRNRNRERIKSKKAEVTIRVRIVENAKVPTLSLLCTNVSVMKFLFFILVWANLNRTRSNFSCYKLKFRNVGVSWWKKNDISLFIQSKSFDYIR